jgi:hypothetical protein
MSVLSLLCMGEDAKVSFVPDKPRNWKYFSVKFILLEAD